MTLSSVSSGRGSSENPFLDALFSSENLDGPAVLYDGECITWSELRERVLRTINVLKQSSLGLMAGGDGIAVSPSNTIEAVVLLMACLVADVPVLLIHERLTEFEQSAIRVRAGVQDRLTLTNLPVWHWPCASLHRMYPDLAVVIFTSGSSGPPKGVVLGRRQLLVAAEASEKRLGWHFNDRWLLSMSMAHVGGFSVLTRCLLARRTIVLVSASRFSGADVWALCEAQQVSLLSVVPTMLKRLLESSAAGVPRSLRAILVGGGMASPSLLWTAWARGWPVLTTYGMTECCSQIATLHPPALPGLWRESIDSVAASSCDELPGCGQPLEGYQMRVRDGMFEVKSRALCYGYLPHSGDLSMLQPCVDEDGWFQTGDLGRLDELQRVHVEGRRSDRIVTGGENVSPLEVELVLESCAGIQGACVFSEDDPEFGQRVVAALVVEGNQWNEDFLTRLMATLRQQLAKFKLPRCFLLTDKLILNSVGKLDRVKTIARARQYAALSFPVQPLNAH